MPWGLLDRADGLEIGWVSQYGVWSPCIFRPCSVTRRLGGIEELKRQGLCLLQNQITGQSLLDWTVLWEAGGCLPRSLLDYSYCSGLGLSLFPLDQDIWL